MKQVGSTRTVWTLTCFTPFWGSFLVTGEKKQLVICIRLDRSLSTASPGQQREEAQTWTAAHWELVNTERAKLMKCKTSQKQKGLKCQKILLCCNSPCVTQIFTTGPGLKLDEHSLSAAYYWFSKCFYCVNLILIKWLFHWWNVALMLPW